MTFAVPIRIADAVVSDLNTAAAADAFSIGEFTAVRSYADWDTKFSDLSGMSVDVVFRSTGRIKLGCYDSLDYEPEIHVAVRKRFGPTDRATGTGRLLNASVDPCVTLLEEIYERYATNRNAVVLSDESTAKWDGTEGVVRWVDQEKLREGYFEGFVAITFLFEKAV